MNTHRKTAIIVGILFIAATTTAVISLLSFAPVIEEDPYDSDYFDNIVDKENQVILAGVFAILLVVSVIAIAVIMYPILKMDSETIAVGYVFARTMEGVIITLGLMCQLAIIALSQDYVDADSPNAANYHTLANLLLETYTWADLLGPVIAFGITAMILNYSYYRTKIMPNFISIWGFIGALLITASGLVGMFGDRSLNFFWAAPIALQEMVMAVWLIVKGFNIESLELDQGK